MKAFLKKSWNEANNEEAALLGEIIATLKEKDLETFKLNLNGYF
jgi:hypothetical protein